MPRTLIDASLIAPFANTFIGMGRNRIINGDCRVDQYNAGSLVTANSTAVKHSVDQVEAIGQAADGVYTIQQVTTSPPNGFTHYIHVAVTTADASVASNQFYYLHIPVEGNTIRDFMFGTSQAKTITVSFRVRSSLTGTFSGCLSGAAFTRGYVFTYVINAANTWETKTITVAGDTTGSWVNNNGKGIGVNFDLGAGSQYESTANAWTAGDFLRAAGSVRVIGTNGATWDMTGLQMELGSVATNFEFRPIQTEMILCQRYLEVQTLVKWCFQGVSGSGYNIPINFAVEKRIAPTMTLAGGTLFNVSSVNSTGITTRGFVLGAGANATSLACVGNSNDASWTADARL